MNPAIQKMLEKYKCQTEHDYINALKEIFQEIALLGLWRAKFYEKAGFYGGSALRILYGLDRFSEDLDFTLLEANKEFDFDIYNNAIAKELNSFGFEAKVEPKIKSIDSQIESAFIKADSKKQMISIEAPTELINRIHSMNKIQIKMEVDVNPPGNFSTEVKTLLLPIPFFVKSLIQPDLFAGKIHALLCRPWQKRVKGRDWYDFIWYIARNVPVHLSHLQERLIQSDAWTKDAFLQEKDLIQLLKEKINKTDFENAKKDILPFINDPQSIDLWSIEFFNGLLNRVKII